MIDIHTYYILHAKLHTVEPRYKEPSYLVPYILHELMGALQELEREQKSHSSN